LWALNLSGGLDEATAREALGHANPHVRAWAVRLACDDHRVSPDFAARLAQAALTEPSAEVRSQLACSARRLPARDDLAIVRNLLTRDEDVNDAHIPLLLWWAIEAKAESDTETVLALFQDTPLWDLPLVRRHIVERLMRRFAATGQRKDLLTCARLLRMSPGPEHTKRLMAGFEAAFAGRSLTNLPEELSAALASYQGVSVILGLRQGRADAVREALAVLADERADKSKQLQYVQVFGEVDQPGCVPVLLKLATQSTDNGLQAAALTALQRYDQEGVGRAVLAAYGRMTDDVRASAQHLLASRRVWALQLLETVEAGRVDKQSVPGDVVEKLARHRDGQVRALALKLWGEVKPSPLTALQKEVDRLAEVVRNGAGVPKQGRPLYQNTCGKCHALFGQGGGVGPDLTSYNRADLERLLLHVVAPSAEIREGYANHFAVTKSGRTVSGFVIEQDARTVRLRGGDGKDVTLAKEEVEEMEASKTSLMPEGQLKGLTDQQVCDLFAYIRMTQPLIDK
jgi:putative heme-binding domain-containing protein